MGWQVFIEVLSLL